MSDILSAFAALALAFGGDNLAMGVPGSCDCLVVREGYALGYSERHEQARYVMYTLTKEEATACVAVRNDGFKADPAISTGSAKPSDYQLTGYDRGHLAPAADMAFSVKAMQDSFYMSNMSPQATAFNRGVWKRLETQVRAWAVQEERVFVVTGPILDREPEATIGASGVAVPRMFFKVVLDMTAPMKAIGFMLPNEGSNADLRTFAVSVDAVEELTGLDFLAALDDDVEDELEKSVKTEEWTWRK